MTLNIFSRKEPKEKVMISAAFSPFIACLNNVLNIFVSCSYLFDVLNKMCWHPLLLLLQKKSFFNVILKLKRADVLWCWSENAPSCCLLEHLMTFGAFYGCFSLSSTSFVFSFPFAQFARSVGRRSSEVKCNTLWGFFAQSQQTYTNQQHVKTYKALIYSGVNL